MRQRCARSGQTRSVTLSSDCRAGEPFSGMRRVRQAAPSPAIHAFPITLVTSRVDERTAMEPPRSPTLENAGPQTSECSHVSIVAIRRDLAVQRYAPAHGGRAALRCWFVRSFGDGEDLDGDSGAPRAAAHLLRPRHRCTPDVRNNDGNGNSSRVAFTEPAIGVVSRHR